MTSDMEDLKLRVAHQIDAVQKMYARYFLYEGEQRPSKAVHKCMVECEQAFSDACDNKDDDLFALAMHLAEVTERIIVREAAVFAADPKHWVETREELRT